MAVRPLTVQEREELEEFLRSHDERAVRIRAYALLAVSNGRDVANVADQNERVYEQFDKAYIEKFGKEPPPLEEILAQYMKYQSGEDIPIKQERGERPRKTKAVGKAGGKSRILPKGRYV